MSRPRMFSLFVALIWLSYAAQGANLVKNGAFEADANSDGVPDDWRTSGRSGMKQTITLDAGRDGGKSAKLECTKFVPGSGSSHAMICQSGTVGVKRSQWYRLTLWAKGTGIAKRMCQVRVANTKPWGSCGIDGRFAVSRTWARVEQLFQADKNVPAETTRLQFWFGSTGTLWLDDVVLEPVDMRPEFHPQVSTEGVRNFIPNSSFECGPSGWGSYAPNMRTWSGNVYRLMGEIDDSTAHHGRRSLRMRVAKDEAPVYYWDYFDPIEEPLHTVAAGHVGWMRLKRGELHVLSCYLKADKPNVPAFLLAHHSSGWNHRNAIRVGTQWERVSFAFTPKGDFAWMGVGLDLANSQLDSATLWVDAVQFELASKASDYAPRSTIESFIETPAVGNVFADPDAGITVDVCAWNGTNSARGPRGRLVVKDFFDNAVLTRPVELSVGAERQARLRVAGLMKGRRGFYRVQWHPEGHAPAFPQALRCALIDSYGHADSPFGMNHAYGWPFLLRLSKAAGLT